MLMKKFKKLLILAEPGDIIRLTSGTYNLEDSLSLDVDNVQIEGEGMNQTILDFKNQQVWSPRAQRNLR